MDFALSPNPVFPELLEPKHLFLLRGDHKVDIAKGMGKEEEVIEVVQVQIPGDYRKSADSSQLGSLSEPK